MSIIFRSILAGVLLLAATAGASAQQPALEIAVKPMPQGARNAWVAVSMTRPGSAVMDDDRADELYSDGRDLIEEGKYERALDKFNRLIDMKTNRTDAALYWKAYSLAKLGRRADALSSLSDLQQQFKNSNWLRDARALEIELRQASGQTVSPENQADDDIKLYALRGLMQSDPERALPIIEQMLAGNNSPKVKDRALFVLSQSSSARAREIIANVAKGGANPDLQLRALKYLGMVGGTESRQILADVYRASQDPAVKRQVMRSFMTSGDRTRLLSLAKSETTAALRGEAVHLLGTMGAQTELVEFYQSETSVDVKKNIIQAMFIGGSADKLIELARNEKDPQLRRAAIRNLGLMGSSRTGDALKAIYQSDQTAEIRREVISGLFLQNNGHVLVELARAEKDPAMKKEMIAKMSVMSKSKEVIDYLAELLR